MEIKNYDNLKYWRIERWGHAAILTCPEMEKADLSFGVKRGILVELKQLEKRLVQNYSWWVGYAKLTDPHIMRMWVKVGADPFFINLNTDRLWFRRKCK